MTEGKCIDNGPPFPQDISGETKVYVTKMNQILSEIPVYDRGKEKEQFGLCTGSPSTEIQIRVSTMNEEENKSLRDV